MITLDLIFRSIINFKDASGNETITQKNLIKNFNTLQKQIPDPPEDTSYNKLYFFINDHIRNCDVSEDRELPSYEIIKKWYEENEGDENVLKILEQIKAQTPYIGQDYYKILVKYREESNIDKLNRLLQDVNKIAQTKEFKEGKGKNSKIIKGIPEALDYFARHSRELRAQSSGIKIESQIISQEDVVEAKKDYEAIKKDPIGVFGVPTGLSVIDREWKNGIQNTEMMLVLAFTSQGKTAFSMHMGYKGIFSGFNTAIITMEQSFKEIRSQIYIKHTCNPIIGKKYPQFEHLVGTLDLRKVVAGTLSPEEEAFYFTACEDLANTESYGKSYIWFPPKAKPTIAEIEFKLMQVQQEYKMMGRDLELVIIDYVTLLGLSQEERTRNTVEDQNAILRQLKSLCNTFNGNKGIRMISPFQASRKGYEEAKKNDGVYQLTALSDYHEAERSSDVVVALYMDEVLRELGTTKFTCLKGRRNGFFKPFNAKMNKFSLFYTDSNIDDEINPIAAIDKIQPYLP